MAMLDETHLFVYSGIRKKATQPGALHGSALTWRGTGDLGNTIWRQYQHYVQHLHWAAWRINTYLDILLGNGTRNIKK
jgi:hypothetical protein